jgi:hypothetical protein
VSVLFHFNASSIHVVKKQCMNIRADAEVYTEEEASISNSGAANWSPSVIQDYNISGDILFNAGQGFLRASVPPLLPLLRPVAVIIHRDERRARSICKFSSYFLPRLQTALPSYEMALYYGNESVQDTLRLFGRSSLVIGYHGAGHANALFSPPGSVIVEFAFSHPLDRSKLYYSQVGVICRVRSGMHCFERPVDPFDSFSSPEMAQLRAAFNGSLQSWTPGFARLHMHRNCVNIKPDKIREISELISAIQNASAP